MGGGGGDSVGGGGGGGRGEGGESLMWICLYQFLVMLDKLFDALTPSNRSV